MDNDVFTQKFLMTGLPSTPLPKSSTDPIRKLVTLPHPRFKNTFGSDGESLARYYSPPSAARQPVMVDMADTLEERTSFPTRPPYVVKLEGLAVDTAEEEIREFFFECAVLAVHIPRDQFTENRSHPFGYAEFLTINGLNKALCLNMSELRGHRVSIIVGRQRGEGPDVRVFEDHTYTGRLPVTQADSRCLAVLRKNIPDRPLKSAIDSFSYPHPPPPCPARSPLVTSAPAGLSHDTLPFKSHQATRLHDLPLEIHDRVLGHLVGKLGSTMSASTQVHGSRNWNIAMRHPRRAQVSELALVSRTWRLLIQQRLYRHVKVKGTRLGLELCGEWFLMHHHLQEHVRHFEVWVPVWEGRRVVQPTPDPVRQLLFPTTVNTSILGTYNITTEETKDLAATFQPGFYNATLDEIFGCAKTLFPKACALTIEGGNCRKPPMIRHFRQRLPTPPVCTFSMYPTYQQRMNLQFRRLPQLTNIRTIVLKGAWNIIRQDSDFQNLATALPNLREWQCAYAKPKSRAYAAICASLKQLPPTIAHLSICLEGLDYKSNQSLRKWRKVYPTNHICHDLGRIFPQLETLTYTGRVCACLFSTARRAASESRDYSRLRSVDLIVKNCCRETTNFNDGTGIHNWAFIQAFAALVLTGVRGLDALKRLNFLRIRFIDLDSPSPLLNPYFNLQNDTCMGLWSAEILDLLGQVRPRAHYLDLQDTLPGGGKNVKMLSSRPKSMKIDAYIDVAEAGSYVA